MDDLTPDDFEDAIPIGTVIADRYRVLGRVGDGSYAVVYRACDTTNGDIVAVKVLVPERFPDDANTWRELVARFQNEERALRQIDDRTHVVKEPLTN